MPEPIPDPEPLIVEVGGEDVVKRLVERFYDLMDELEGAKTIREMHANNMKRSRDHLFKFLLFWMGGRETYIEERGHPRLRLRHAPFVVDRAASDAWMMCMDQALGEVIDDEGLQRRLSGAFRRIAHHMENQAPQ